MSSGDDIEAGRITTGESTTFLVAAVPSATDVDFNGGAVLHVGPQAGDLSPAERIDGVVGVGHARFAPEPGAPDGAGVVGHGGVAEGPGVVAVGGGGGVGLRAHGGRGGVTSSRTNHEAAPGVVAQGGAVDFAWSTQEDRRAPGPGVVAVAGGSTQAVTPQERAAAGVVGQGGDAVTRTVVRDGATFVVGSGVVGPGVVGRGGLVTAAPGPGQPAVPVGSGGAGVVGVAGGVPADAGVLHSLDTGVLGVGGAGAGVLGASETAPDVLGESNRGPGVMAVSRRAPQVRLEPIDAASPLELGPTVAAGDLLALRQVDEERGTELATLWFCTSVRDGTPSWARLA